MSARIATAAVWMGAAWLTALAGPRLSAQPRAAWQNPEQAIVITMPAETSLTLVAKDFEGTEIAVRGGAVVIDLQGRLELRNDGEKTLRGAAFVVRSLDGAAGGRASVFAPSLSVARGESFPIELNLRLLRPLPSGPGALLEVALDGVLRSDLTFAGPDRLGSERRMKLFESEASADRLRLRQALTQGGEAGLRGEALAILQRQAERPQLEARLAGGGGQAVAAALSAPGTPVELALLNLPGAPVELLSGSATAAGAAADSPLFQVRNRSAKSIRRFEVGWIINDTAGERYPAATASSGEGALAPGATGRTAPGKRFEFVRPDGSSFAIGGMSGYVRRVEFGDGTLWTPSSADLSAAELLRLEPLTPEQRRLSTIYRRNGLSGLIRELERF